MFPAFSPNSIFSPQVFVPVKDSSLSWPLGVGGQFPLLTRQPIHLVQTSNFLPASSVISNSNRRVAVVFSGGPAPGGHNVVAALFDVLDQQKISLLGAMGGPKGLLRGDFCPIGLGDRNRIFNTGGFWLLGTDRTKISSSEQINLVRTVCQQHNIDGLIIVGGDDSNTNAAFLAEGLFADKISVISVPKTIDGDLQVREFLPISFGFDTATKVYTETVENLLCEAQSSQKYWHFVKLMGRSASHISLEVALQTQPHIALISEEIWAQQLSFSQIVQSLAQSIMLRFRRGLNYGVVLIPEGILERIDLLDPMLPSLNFGKKDSHGNSDLSSVPTEVILAQAVQQYLQKSFSNVAFSYLCHFLGYEARCAVPSAFDMGYTYLLGQAAANLYLQKYTGYLACVGDLSSQGLVQAICIPALFTQEVRNSVAIWAVQKSLVTLNSPALLALQRTRKANLLNNPLQLIGPRQYDRSLPVGLPKLVVLNECYTSFSSRIWERFL